MKWLLGLLLFFFQTSYNRADQIQGGAQPARHVASPAFATAFPSSYSIAAPLLKSAPTKAASRTPPRTPPRTPRRNINWDLPAAGVPEVLAALSETESGRKLIERAQEVWRNEREPNETHSEVLLRKIQFGTVSKTDAVLTRHYQPENGSESRTRLVTVILKKNQKILDQVLDLGHELIHALAPPSWDPYDPTLSPGRYIFALLEKKGGEIEAVTSECQVAGEIEKTFGIQTKRCDRYFENAKNADAAPVTVSKAKIQKDFYRVGKWSFLVKTKLKDEAKMFPFLSQMEPELYSATGRAPYPAALIREYEEITKVACVNVLNRKRASIDRAPASSGSGKVPSEDTDLFLSSRCPAYSIQEALKNSQSSIAH